MIDPSHQLKAAPFLRPDDRLLSDMVLFRTRNERDQEFAYERIILIRDDKLFYIHEWNMTRA